MSLSKWATVKCMKNNGGGGGEGKWGEREDEAVLVTNFNAASD